MDQRLIILIWTITCGHFSCPVSHYLLTCLHLPCLGDLQKGEEREGRQRNRVGPFPGQSSQRHLAGAQNISGYFSSPITSVFFWSTDTFFSLMFCQCLRSFYTETYQKENGIYIQTKVWDSTLTWWKDKVITQVLSGCWWLRGLQVKGFNSRVSLWGHMVLRTHPILNKEGGPETGRKAERMERNQQPFTRNYNHQFPYQDPPSWCHLWLCLSLA